MQDNFQEIVNGLFLGNAKSLENHQKFDIIINCTKNIHFPNNHEGICIRIPIEDDPSNCKTLLFEINNTQVLEHIEMNIQNKKSVLVHCSMGMQRSCALVACYLIKYYRQTPNIAIEYIKTKRPIAFFGNVNFLSAIEDYYRDISKKKYI